MSNVKKGLNIPSIVEQYKSIKLFLLLLYLPALLALLAVVLVSKQAEIPIYKFMRDPSAIAGISSFAGIVSNLGVLLWCASAAISLFSWAVLRHRASEGESTNFFLYSGLMTTILMLDDLFQLHEKARRFGMSEKIILITYGVLIFLVITKFAKYILETERLILLIALFFLGLSFSIDLFQYRIEPFMGQWRILLEDGFKFLGIVGWLGYFAHSCFCEIKELVKK